MVEIKLGILENQLKQIRELEDQIKKLQQKNLGLVFEDKKEEVTEKLLTNLPYLVELPERRIKKSLNNNYLIEGDNFITLSILNFTHKGKVDLIYIDPPYNTGAKNWKYNNDFVDKEDSYRHSKWLSFMQHRLKIARNLLTEDGALVVAIDHNEQEHLGLLLENMFPNYDRVCVTIIHNPGGIQGDNFSYTHENAYFVYPKGKKVISRVIRDDEKPTPLRDWGGEESKRHTAKNCFYPIIVENGEIIGFGDVAPNDFNPKSANEIQEDGSIYVWPIDNNGVQRKWRHARQSVEEIWTELRCETNNDEYVINRYKNKYRYKTVWTDKKYNANIYGTKLLREILPGCDFDYPKSLYTTYDCLAAIVKDKPNAIVLDFFAGSGTTGHAILEMNREDGGNRTFILCTNNENNNKGSGGVAETVCYPRLSKVINGYESKKTKYPEIFTNLFYFKSELFNVENANKLSDDEKLEFAGKMGQIIALRENTPEIIQENEFWLIYESENKITAIYYSEDKRQIRSLVDLVEEMDKECVLYVTGWGKNEYSSDYATSKIRVEEFPEPFFEIIRNINRQ